MHHLHNELAAWVCNANFACCVRGAPVRIYGTKSLAPMLYRMRCCFSVMRRGVVIVRDAQQLRLRERAWSSTAMHTACDCAPSVVLPA